MSKCKNAFKFAQLKICLPSIINMCDFENVGRRERHLPEWSHRQDFRNRDAVWTAQQQTWMGEKCLEKLGITNALYFLQDRGKLRKRGQRDPALFSKW